MKEHCSSSSDVEIIAGHCSVSPEHFHELYEMSEIMVSDGSGGKKRGLSAVRLVGLKSRTEYNVTGDAMGMDFPVLEQAIVYGTADTVPPSVLLAEQFVKDTGMGVAAEMIYPTEQMGFYEGRIPDGRFMPWSPSNEQLGGPLRKMGIIAARHNWTVGIKNGKWLDIPYEDASDMGSETVSTLEKTWIGLATYAKAAGANIAFIHRGVDIPEKGDHRNALIHGVVAHLAKRVPEARRYFDPSHSLGPKLRDRIVEETIEAMRMRAGNDFLYNGILIEAGTSMTDTKQHVTIEELRIIIEEVSKFRTLRGPVGRKEAI